MISLYERFDEHSGQIAQIVFNRSVSSEMDSI